MITVEPPQEGEKRAEVMSPSQPFLMIGYKRPDQRDKDDPVFDVLSSILSSGRTGMLYKEMVRDKKIALGAQAQSSFPGSKYPNLFLFFVAPSLGRTVEENEKACYEILERLKTEKVDEETLNRVKTKIRASVIRGLGQQLGDGGAVGLLLRQLRKLAQAVYGHRRYREGDRRGCAASGPRVLHAGHPHRGLHRDSKAAGGGGRQMRRATKLIPLLLVMAWLAGAQVRPAAAPEPSYKDLKYPPLKEVKIPEVARYTLPNGMKVYLLENHELPLVSGFALVRTGNLFDPPDKIGLAGITGTVMRTGGTAARTGDQLDSLLENMAASVESSIGETSGRVSFSALRENTGDVLAMFKEVLTQPEFRQDKIDLIKSQTRSSIARRNDEADEVAGREFSETIYGRDNSYGWRLEYEHLDRIAREDLQNFYRRYFFPSNILLAVYGDFSTAEMRGQLEKLFADWKVAQPAVPAFPPVREKPAPGVYLAAKSDVTQTFFQLGHLGGTLRDKDYPALEVMADILGGSFRSRLVKRVRTQLGYAYDVSAAWAANYDHPGVFVVSGSTKSATTTEALEVIREEIQKMRTAEVTAEELQVAKDTVLNSFVFNFDSPGKTLSRMVNYDYFGYPADFIFQYQKAVAAVTRADILRVAKQYIKPESFTIVAAGKPQDFGRPLSALGLEVKTIDLTIPVRKTP